MKLKILSPSSASQLGSALVEYALLIALLAVVVVPAVSGTGVKVENNTRIVADALQGFVFPCVTSAPDPLLPPGCTP